MEETVPERSGEMAQDMKIFPATSQWMDPNPLAAIEKPMMDPCFEQKTEIRRKELKGSRR